MKLREKWAKEQYRENGCIAGMVSGGGYSYESAWLDGFEFARQMCSGLIKEWEGIDHVFDGLGNGEAGNEPE